MFCLESRFQEVMNNEDENNSLLSMIYRDPIFYALPYLLSFFDTEVYSALKFVLIN